MDAKSRIFHLLDLDLGIFVIDLSRVWSRWVGVGEERRGELTIKVEVEISVTLIEWKVRRR